MTTTVLVMPHGHNVEVLVTDREGGEMVTRTDRPDPHGAHHYAAYDERTIAVRELEGWAPKPDASPAA